MRMFDTAITRRHFLQGGSALAARAALAGLSFAITDIRTPETKPAILDEGQKKADRIEKNYKMGAITAGLPIPPGFKLPF